MLFSHSTLHLGWVELFTSSLYFNNTIHATHTYAYCIYRIAGFYCEDFNITFGSICNIKICVIFVKRNILWLVSHSNTSIILQAIVYRSTIDLLGFINVWIHYRLHVHKVTAHLRRCPYLSIHMVATNTGRGN